jgi:hypothetical protein
VCVCVCVCVPHILWCMKEHIGLSPERIAAGTRSSNREESKRHARDAERGKSHWNLTPPQQSERRRAAECGHERRASGRCCAVPPDHSQGSAAAQNARGREGERRSKAHTSARKQRAAGKRRKHPPKHMHGHAHTHTAHHHHQALPMLHMSRATNLLENHFAM